jgi:hypothetical protein
MSFLDLCTYMCNENTLLPIIESPIACFRMLLRQTPTGAWGQSVCMAHNSVCAEVMHMNVK